MFRFATLATLVLFSLSMARADEIDDYQQSVSDARTDTTAMLRGLGLAVGVSLFIALCLWVWLTRREFVVETTIAISKIIVAVIRLPVLWFVPKLGTAATLLIGIPLSMPRSMRRMLSVLAAGGTLMIGIALGLFGLNGGLGWELRPFSSLYRNGTDGGYYQRRRRFWHLDPRMLESPHRTEERGNLAIPTFAGNRSVGVGNVTDTTNSLKSFPVLASEMMFVVARENWRDSKR